MFHCVYILQSQRDRKFYIGQTTDVLRRLSQHNAGLNQSTRHRRPFKLIFFESFLSPKDTTRREQYFKSSKGKTTLRQMICCYLDQEAKP